MKVALVTTWRTPVPGREAQAIAYGREVDDFWGKQAADGKCSEPEWFWASKGPSMWIVKGEMHDLQELMAMPEVQRLLFTGRLLTQDFEYGFCMYGREENLTPYEAVAKELSLV